MTILEGVARCTEDYDSKLSLRQVLLKLKILISRDENVKTVASAASSNAPLVSPAHDCLLNGSNLVAR